MPLKKKTEKAEKVEVIKKPPLPPDVAAIRALGRLLGDSKNFDESYEQIIKTLKERVKHEWQLKRFDHLVLQPLGKVLPKEISASSLVTALIENDGALALLNDMQAERVSKTPKIEEKTSDPIEQLVNSIKTEDQLVA